MKRFFVVSLLISFLFLNSAWAKDSVFSNPAVFKDEEGKEVRLEQYLGQTSIVTMAYTQCRKTCPMLTMASLRELQKELDLKKQTAQFVIISLDPSNDTPEVMKKFKEKQHIQRANWHFLTGNEAETRSVAKNLGLSDYWHMDDHILHGFSIHIFGESGNLQKILDWDHRDTIDIF